MLSGIKFIPRENINDQSDSDNSPERRRKSKSEKKRHAKKKSKRKTCYRSSEDDDATTPSASESFSDSEEELIEKKKSKSRRGNSSCEDDSPSSSESDRKKRKKKKKKHSKEEIREENEKKRESSRRENETSRREMGLDWMLKSRDTSTVKADPIMEVREEVAAEQEVRPNPRELNPYLKDNGKGFPEEDEKPKAGNLLASSLVGDGGVSWRLKALKRAKEQAAREGRKLDEVVEERWGSLSQLAVSVASRKSAHVNAHQHAIKDRRRGNHEKSENTDRDQSHSQNLVQRDYLRDVSSRHPEMRKPRYDSTEWRKKKTSEMKDDRIISDALSSLNKFSDDGSFMAKFTAKQGNDSRVSESSIRETVKSEKEEDISVQGLTSNQVAAKAMQLRLKGKHEEAEKLLKEAEVMRKNQDSNVRPITRETKGDPSRYGERRVPAHIKKQEDDGDLHLAQKIIRDRKFSVSGQADEEYDFDGAPARKGKKKREVERESHRGSSHRMLTQQERCQFCFESQSQSKHLIISIANFTYLMLPQYQPLVPGHCCILPMQHEASTRTVDDNVWDEIRNFKKCLIMMFAKQEKGVIFIETVVELSRQRRHCLVECIPLPHDLAEEAPMYFKKAIDEAEDEWSQHNAKKLIETTSERGLRRAIPKDFPYFHVEFGLDRGFVHVIDDEANFNTSIGLNVVRGMLQLPEEDMYRRRRRHESTETQKSVLLAFSREWEHFDWTKQLG